MEMTKELGVFRSAPVPKTVLKNPISAMAAMGASGLAWAQPVAALLSTVLVVFLYVSTVKQMETNSKKQIVSL